MRLFYKQRTESKQVFTGNVRFANDSELKIGRIFGAPVPGASVYHYYIEIGKKVYLIPEFAIEQL